MITLSLLFLLSLGPGLSLRLRLVLGLLVHLRLGCLVHLGLRLGLRLPLHLGLRLRLPMHLWLLLERRLLLVLGRLSQRLLRPALRNSSRGGWGRAWRAGLHLPLSGVLPRGDAGLGVLLMPAPGPRLVISRLGPLPGACSLGWSGSRRDHTF